MDAKLTNQSKKMWATCFITSLSLLFLAALLVSLLWCRLPQAHVMPDQVAEHRIRAMNRVFHYIVFYWESWDSKSRSDREELIMKEARQHQSDITIYRLWMGGNDEVFGILIVPSGF